MPTYSDPYPSKTAWTLRLVVTEDALDAANNRSEVFWRLRLYRGDSSTPFNNESTSYVVSGPYGFSGTFAPYRFGSSGTGTNFSSVPVGDYVTIANSGGWVDHDSDGSKTVTFAASHAAAATLGTASIGSSNFTLTKLTQTPNAPTGVTATRVSDSEITVSWSQSHPSNGQPTANGVQRRVNGGAWADVATVSPATSVSVGASVDQKIEYRVNASNSAGTSAWSSPSTPIFTTPDAPSGVSASKDAALDITVAWTPNVAFTEHQHVVEFSTNAGSSWSSLATVAAGTSSYKHVSPNPANVHVYRVRARNTSTPNLTSGWVESNSVQLLAAPNAPTLADVPNFAAKTVDLVIPWTHNPVDTTPQTAYEFEYSTNGGTTYTSTGKVTSTVSQYTVAANTYAADVALTVRVRTWGEATTGGADGTGASPWSSTDTVTFKTRPVATITTPADLSTYTQADLTVVLGFAQAESASFVSATIVLSEGATELESLTSTTLVGTLMDTQVEDATTYTLSVTVLDSNGLTSTAVASTFDVAYTKPVAATFTAVFDQTSGTVGLAVTIPSAGVGEAEAESVTISRVIDGVRETLFSAYPVSVGSITFRDMTPVTFGSNEYRVRTNSADGATTDTVETLAVAEGVWAYLSTGAQFDDIVTFWGDLEVADSPARASSLVQASGRAESIALFGENTSLQVSGTATILPDEGSTAREIAAFIKRAGIVSYRDPRGTRIKGRLTGSVASPSSLVSTFTFAIDEAS